MGLIVAAGVQPATAGAALMTETMLEKVLAAILIRCDCEPEHTCVDAGYASHPILLDRRRWPAEQVGYWDRTMAQPESTEGILHDLSRSIQPHGSGRVRTRLTAGLLTLSLERYA